MPRLSLVALWLLPVVAAAQVSGHGGVPTTGPAAQERGRPQRELDPVATRIERIRTDLGELSRRYRKARGEERAELARRLAPRLEEIASLVARLEPEPRGAALQ